MEKFAKDHKYGIPGQEMADMALSPVTQEEMDAEMELLRAEMKDGADNSAEKVADEVEAMPESKISTEALRESIIKSADAFKKVDSDRKAQDAIRIEEIRNEIMASSETDFEQPTAMTTPATELKPARPEELPLKNDGEDEPDSFIMHHGDANIEQKECPVCHGSGRKFIFFTCSRCNGYGAIGVNKGMTWTQKVIKRKN